jgi:hypothetical protein
MRMIFFELDKTVVKNRGVLFIVLALIIKVVILNAEDHAINLFTYENRTQYLPIINTYAGKITEAVSAEIETQYTAVTEAQVNLTSLRQKYNSGEITEANYYTESRALEKLVNEKDLFLTFYSQYIYAREKPEERYLLYDDGWNALLAQERLDWGFVLLIIVFAASVFGREYESDMRSTLIATKKGNTHLIAAKFISILMVVILCSVISSCVEYLFFSLKFGLPHGNYPLQSLSYFQDSAFHLTLQQTYLYISAYRLFGLFILAVVTMLISVLVQKTIVALSAGLMFVVLPYALPVNASVKYLLSSPLGFILAQGFFRGTQMGEAYQANQVLFQAISQSLQIRLVIGWLVLAGIMLFVIARKFLSARPFWPFRKQQLVLPLVLLILACLAGCSSPTASNQTMDRVFNLADDSRFTVVNGEIVVLFPSFLMENMETHEVNDVIRDPFADDETIDQTVASIFSRDGKLDYLVKTDDELKIVELELSTYRTKTLYDEDVSKIPALIHSDLEVHKWGLGKENLAFFVDGNDIYLLSDMNLRRVNSVTGAMETLIKNIYGRNVAFDGEKIYYINTTFEIKTYNLASGEDNAISNIRADFLYVRGKKIYYRNVDKDGVVYVYDIQTQRNKAVIQNRTFYFVCDDDYLYYTNQEDQGYLYRANLQTGVSEFIAPLSGYNIQIVDGYPLVYYRVDGSGFTTETYRINKQTLSYEKIEEYQRSE